MTPGQLASLIPCRNPATPVLNCFLEQFASGLTPYTVTAEPFSSSMTIVSGLPYGAGGLGIDAPACLGIGDIYRATTSLSSTTFSCKFINISPSGIDDSLTVSARIGGYPGTFQWALIPRRETFYDAARRPLVSIDTESIYCGVGGEIAMDTWYQCDLAVAAGAGNSTWKFTRLSDNTVVMSGNFTNAHTPRAIDTLVFHIDGTASSGTTHTQIADVEICGPPGADPNGPNVILLVGYGDFVDHSPLALGTATPVNETVDAVNTLGGISTIACSGAAGQIAQWANSLSTITMPAIFEVWFKCGIPGDIYSHPILSGYDSSHNGPFLGMAGTVSVVCQWGFTNHAGSAVPQPSQIVAANAWNYVSMLVDVNHSVAHSGLVGGSTTPTALGTGSGVGTTSIPTGPHWAIGSDTTDSATVTEYINGNLAQIRVTQGTTRGYAITNNGSTGVSYTVPPVPFSLP